MKRLAYLLLAALPAFAAESGAEGQHDMTPWLWANFLILMGALSYLAVKYGGPFLQSRQESISKGLDDAAAMKADAERRTAEVNERLSRMDADIDALKRQMLEEQQLEAKRLAERNAAEIARIQAQTEQEIAAAGKAARLELQAHAAQLAVDLAEQKLRRNIDPDAQHRLTRTFVESLR